MITYHSCKKVVILDFSMYVLYINMYVYVYKYLCIYCIRFQHMQRFLHWWCNIRVLYYICIIALVCKQNCEQFCYNWCICISSTYCISHSKHRYTKRGIINGFSPLVMRVMLIMKIIASFPPWTTCYRVFMKRSFFCIHIFFLVFCPSPLAANIWLQIVAEKKAAQYTQFNCQTLLLQ